MNPWDLSASDLLVWGIALHLFADWPLQNDWMARNKVFRWPFKKPGEVSWWLRHPAAYVHAGIHCVLLAFIFGWVAIPLAVIHLIIDCRWPIERWSNLIKQTQPKGRYALAGQNPLRDSYDDEENEVRLLVDSVPLYDIGIEVRIWTDQVFHIFCIAVAALLVTL